MPIELLTRKKYCGKSADGKGDNHHILDKSLFPKKGAPTINVSKEKYFELNARLPKPQSHKVTWTKNKPSKPNAPKLSRAENTRTNTTDRQLNASPKSAQNGI